MDNFNPEEWARNNKNKFVSNFLSNQKVTKEKQPVAIFMAGLPGSGKTEFSKNLIKNARLNVARLDMDEIASNIDGYTPEKANLFRGGASILLERIFDKIIDKNYSFVMDGTFGSKKALKNIERAIKHKYIVSIIWLLQTPKDAWFYTKEREKVEHRAIDRKGFIDSYYNILYNMETIADKYKEQISVDIIKKRQQEIQNWQTNVNNNVIISEIKKKLVKEEIEKYVN